MSLSAPKCTARTLRRRYCRAPMPSGGSMRWRRSSSERRRCPPMPGPQLVLNIVATQERYERELANSV